jgi:GGDEF domain-containing protein
MDTPEIAVWSTMLGGLLTLTALAVGDALFSRNIASLRNLLFVVVTSTACVVMSGLFEAFFPGERYKVMLLLKASTGPLAGAIALKYLGIWLGGMQEDVIVHRITAWGSGVLFFCAFVLALSALQVSNQDVHSLMLATATINMAAVLLALVTALRAATLGDPLARWMVLACISLAGMVFGLDLRVLRVEGYGLGVWVFTAVCTVAYFLIVSVLVIMRNRQNRRLARLANLQFGADPATGLPTGSILLSKVEHTFWRTARFGGECTVVCLHLRNLYELGEVAGHGVEHQILAAMAARIRRAAGFRCVVGLYHPRCFVVVISADKRRRFVNMTVSRLQHLVADPLSVVGQDGARHNFTPDLGVGVVTLNPASADPLEAITDAERQALGPASAPQRVAQDAIETRPVALADAAGGKVQC